MLQEITAWCLAAGTWSGISPLGGHLALLFSLLAKPHDTDLANFVIEEPRGAMPKTEGLLYLD
jgi:hypothetical protein